MTATAMAATLQQIDETLKIGGGISVRPFDRVTHAGLGREMDHRRKRIPGEQRLHGLPIGEIDSGKLEGGMILQEREPSFLQTWIIVVADVVKTGHATAQLQEPLRDVKSDEACGARDEDCAFARL